MELPPSIPTSPEQQHIQDAEHLRLLTIFHYVVGGLTALFFSFGLIHFFIGLTLILNPGVFTDGAAGRAGNPPPAFFGYLFAGIGAFVVLFGWTVGGLTAYSGRCIKQRRKRLFSLVMAGFNCLIFPFGTALGVFTFIVLQRPSVAALYLPPLPSVPGRLSA
jgi:hypothetical protein